MQCKYVNVNFPAYQCTDPATKVLSAMTFLIVGIKIASCMRRGTA